MNEFTIVALIGRRVDEVFADVEDVAKTPVWTPRLSEVCRTSDDPLAPGATIVYTGAFLGRRYESPAVCTGFIENKHFGMKTTSGPFYPEAETRLEPVTASTRVTSTDRGESRSFFKLAEPLVVRLTRRQFRGAAENLRALLEDYALAPEGS